MEQGCGSVTGGDLEVIAGDLVVIARGIRTAAEELVELVVKESVVCPVVAFVDSLVEWGILVVESRLGVVEDSVLAIVVFS